MKVLKISLSESQVFWLCLLLESGLNSDSKGRPSYQAILNSIRRASAASLR
jgi:hypothetical protein